MARELPAKLEQTIYCELEPAQRASSTTSCATTTGSRCSDDVDASGLEQARRSTSSRRCCACARRPAIPGLIDPKRAAEPSAKLDVLLAAARRRSSTKGTRPWSSRSSPACWPSCATQLDGAGHRLRVPRRPDARPRRRASSASRPTRTAALFLISLKAGGLGLNLTAADYVFLLDPWWNPAVEAQAIDRAHRIGQTRHVFAYRLIARDTVEEKVLELQAAEARPGRRHPRPQTRACCAPSPARTWSCCWARAATPRSP